MPNDFVHCPHCNTPIVDGGQLMGQLVQCPRCHGQFQVDGPPALQEVEVQESAISSMANTMKLVAIIGGMLLVTIMIGLWSMGIISFDRGNLYSGERLGTKGKTPIDNYNAINAGMTEAEVVALIGPPAKKFEVPDPILGQQTLANFNYAGMSIQVRFVGGKVYDKMKR
jgi:hypothetical protein